MPPLTYFRRVGAIDPVADFRHGERTQNDGDFANSFPNRFDGLIESELPALGRDQHTGIKH